MQNAEAKTLSILATENVIATIANQNEIPLINILQVHTKEQEQKYMRQAIDGQSKTSMQHIRQGDTQK